ncbi:cation-translocating P-type ATPase [Hoyosella sp. G463]|uniref:Cation-translocating P-type ATPase n=1 Tax=Lolliginicoccus lacisalsi TaxID=2742202 RepID=A0A927PJU5_9ACTN|nr:cation-translocating P-type ATPase [Lolliginicoccus lacisalsi]MBD8504948.1 cation-translocating P-type ATPase [Lolliginicoccus lacisalsi]
MIREAIRHPTIRAALLAAALLAASVPLSGLPATVLVLASALVGASTFVPRAVARLPRHIGVGTLMSIAMIGAVLLGAYTEAALLGILFSLAEGLEALAVTRTRRSLRALHALIPDTVTIERGGTILDIPAAELTIGDTLVLAPGQRAATDATITGGRTSLDVSAITGESIPIEAGPGDALPAGAINGTSAITARVTAEVADSSLARIVTIVEQAQQDHGARQRIADRIARPLVPTILLLATAITVIGALLGDPMTWIERGLVVLVAASPCALAISVPLTVVAAVGGASRAGMVVGSGRALEALGAVTILALDKTGTLTANTPTVIGARGTGHAADPLAVAAALEERSDHPLAAPIVEAAQQRAASRYHADDVQAVPGRGITGTIDAAPARLGAPGWIPLPTELEENARAWQESGATVVAVELAGEVIGILAVRDELRPEAPAVVKQLRDRGIRTVMLTGDSEPCARALAAECGIDEVHASLLPEDKAEVVASLRRTGTTAMVGDGINDAPALATADTGIAMGAMGSDAAVAAADCALLGNDLRHLPQVLDHARRARGIMVQNIALSLAIITILVPLAATGLLGLATVVLIHESAEVLVILNAIRAARIRRLDGSAPEAVAVPAPATGARGPGGLLAQGENGGSCCDHC